MKEKEIKAQIKSIFESESFDSAVANTQELFKQLEELKGKKSASALMASLKKKYQNTRIEKEEDLAPAEPEQPAEAKEEKQEPYKFDVATTGTFSPYWIDELLRSNAPLLNQFCIVQEYFKQSSDTDTVRFTRMFVKSDGTGFDKYDEGSAAAKSAGLKSFRTLGYFDNSEDGFPVGMEYCQIQVIRIKRTLEKYFVNRRGATQISCAENVSDYKDNL